MEEILVTLQVFSLGSELTGALMMANGLAGAVPPRELPKALLRALFKPPRVEALLGDALNPEDRALTFKGLAFLVLGFGIQFLALVATLIASWIRETS